MRTVLTSLTLAALTSLTLATSAFAAAPSAEAIASCNAKRGCEAKFCHIQLELDQARAAGNTRKAAGLEKALSEAKSSCTAESLAADHARDVKEKEAKVQERRDDLATAQKDGKARKIERAQKKLQDAEAELKKAQSEGQ